MDTPAPHSSPTGAPAAPPRRRQTTALMQILLLVLVVYAAFLALLYFSQATLLFPGSQSQGQTSAQVTPPPGVELIRLTTRMGDGIAALFGPALNERGEPRFDARNRPTLLYFYGNGMSLRDMPPQIEEFRRLGVNVLAPEYVGYGMSEGKAGEAGCYATADAAYDYLQTRADVDARRIVAGGWSLGGAVAIDLAARRPVSGLACFSTFTSITEIAQQNYPQVPVALLLRHRFSSDEKIARVRCPILLGHGAEDALIPFSMRDRLAARAGGPVTRITVPEADHNDFFTVGGEGLLQDLARFLDTLPPLPEETGR